MAKEWPYGYKDDDYQRIKEKYIKYEMKNLENNIAFIQKIPVTSSYKFPIIINASAIYEAYKGKQPKDISVLKKYFESNKDEEIRPKHIDSEIKNNSELFRKYAENNWRNSIVDQLVKNLEYNPKKAGENRRFQEALRLLFAEYLEDEYIADTSFIHASLERAVFIKKNPGENWYSISAEHLAAAPIKEKRKALKPLLHGILKARVEMAAQVAENGLTQENENAALAALKEVEREEPAAAGIDALADNTAGLADRNNGNSNANIMAATMESYKTMPPIFRGLGDADIVNLRTVAALNAFVRSKFDGILADDILNPKRGNLYIFMGYKGLAAGHPLQELNQMHQNETSGEGSDCLVHTFLTITCAAFRKLPNELKDPVARSFRHDLYPRFAEVAAVLAAERRVKSAPPYREATQPNLYRIFTVGQFLNDSDIGWLSDIYHINMLIFQSPASAGDVRQPAIITFIEKNPGGVVYTFSNHGNFHFESVQNTETNSFTISHVVANRIKAEGQKQLPPEAKVTGCRFNTGDPITWNGGEWFVISRRSEGGERCIEYFIADEDNFTRFNRLDQAIKDTSNTTKWTRARIDFNAVPADEIHAQNPGRGGGRRRRRHTRRKRRSGQGLKSRRHHSFRNPR
jgi:hypothetical protein